MDCIEHRLGDLWSRAASKGLKGVQSWSGSCEMLLGGPKTPTITTTVTITIAVTITITMVIFVSHRMAGRIAGRTLISSDLKAPSARLLV